MTQIAAAVTQGSSFDATVMPSFERYALRMPSITHPSRRVNFLLTPKPYFGLKNLKLNDAEFFAGFSVLLYTRIEKKL